MGDETSIDVFSTPSRPSSQHGVQVSSLPRDGIEQRPISEDGNYDFNFQETRLLGEEVTIKRGDHLVFEYHYQSMDRDKVTFMCEAFAMYYPRIPLSDCNSGVEADRVAKIANVSLYGSDNFTVSEPAELRGKSLDDLMTNHMDWTKEITALAQREATSYKNPVPVDCFRDMETAFPVNGKIVTPPTVKQTWKTNRKCDSPIRDSPPDNGRVRDLPCLEALLVTASLLLFFS